jgi:hypothetical protein
MNRIIKVITQPYLIHRNSNNRDYSLCKVSFWLKMQLLSEGPLLSRLLGIQQYIGLLKCR